MPAPAGKDAGPKVALWAIERPRTPPGGDRRPAFRSNVARRPTRSARQQPQLAGTVGRLHARAAAELAQDVAHVHVDRAAAEEQRLRDLAGSCARRRPSARPRARAATTLRRRRPRPRAPEPAGDRLAQGRDLARRLGRQRARAELAGRAVGDRRAARARLALARSPPARRPRAARSARARRACRARDAGRSARAVCSAAVSASPSSSAVSAIAQPSAASASGWPVCDATRLSASAHACAPDVSPHPAKYVAPQRSAASA